MTLHLHLHLYHCQTCGAVLALSVIIDAGTTRCAQAIAPYPYAPGSATRCDGVLAPLTLGDFLTTAAASAAVDTFQMAGDILEGKLPIKDALAHLHAPDVCDGQAAPPFVGEP